MIVSLIAAVAENLVIGKDNDLIWNLPDDMKHFKDTTSGHYIVMGRKNFDSMRRALPNRTNIVITRQKDYEAPGAVVTHSLKEALDYAEANGQEETFVIGGGEIYAQALSLADKLYITSVHASFDGDTYFPEVDYSQWEELESRIYQQDERNKYPFTIQTFGKKS